MLKRLIRAAGMRIRNLLGSGKKRPSTPSADQAGAPEMLPDAEQVVQALHDAGPEDGEGGSRPAHSRRRRRKPKQDWDIDRFQVEPEAGKTRFHDFPLPETIMHAIADLGFQYCTPIQEKALPEALAGKDLVGRANTGTGKSAVFLIAVFSKLLGEIPEKTGAGRPRALIIAPTRELVMQIAKDGRSLAQYTSLQIFAVFGGVDYRSQMQDLQEKHCDVVVATPGRLLDYLGKNVFSLDDCRTLVIDEADRMLDMGFIPDVRRIIHRIPERSERQTMLFSATVTDEVRRLAAQWCVDPVQIEIEPEQVTVESVEQIVYLVTTAEKYDVLYNLIRKRPGERVLVFVNQKNEAKRLCERLKRNGINGDLLTGDVQQQKRMNRLEDFRAGRLQVLVATDVAGRGIHIDDISHVVNYTLPYEPEDYVHRIGRTGRAGATGTSVSFACEEGSFYLPQIEEFIGRKLDCVVPDESLLIPAPKGSHAPAKNGESPEAPRRKRRPRPRRREVPTKSG